jgi:predicted dehydrogenase
VSYFQDFKKELARRSSPAVIHCRVNSPGISPPYWMADPAIGGAILGEACHFIDLMCWMLNAEVDSVSAYSLPTGVADPVGENNLAASFHFTDGSVGNLTYCTVGSKTSGGERVEAFAPGVGLKTEDFKWFSAAKGMRHDQRRFWPEKGYQAQMDDFFDAIRKGRQPQVTVADGARSTIVCLRMLESARLRSACPVNARA